MSEMARRALECHLILYDATQSENPWGLNEWFRRECEARGLTVSSSTIGRWFRGDVEPTTELAEEAWRVLLILEDKAHAHLQAKMARLTRVYE